MDLKTACKHAWNFDGNALGNASSNNCSAVGVTYSTVDGCNGQAAYMNGSATLKATQFNVGNNDFTFIWRGQRGTTGSIQYMIASIASSGQNITISIIIRFNSDNTISAYAFHGVDFEVITTTDTYTSTSAWYHVVFRRSGNTLELFIDNVSKGTTSLTVAVNDSISSFGIGNAGDFTSFRFNGYIDYVQYFDSALPSDALYSLYNGGKGLQYPFAINGFLTYFMSKK